MHKSVYLPREDSSWLAKWVEKLAKGKVLDMGAGSGVLARAALKKTQNVLASDINPEAVKHCKSIGIDTVQSNLFNKIEGKFNLIIFNPPYLPLLSGEDQETALTVCGGKIGCEVIARFLKDAKRFLKPKGKILLLFSSLSGDVCSLFKQYGYRASLLEEKKMPDKETLFVYLLRT